MCVIIYVYTYKYIIMSTRAGFNIKYNGKERYYTRHSDGHADTVARELDTVEDLSDVLEIVEKLYFDMSCKESGTEYYYIIDVDNGTIEAYFADWRTDQPTKLIFKGSIGEFINHCANM